MLNSSREGSVTSAVISTVKLLACIFMYQAFPCTLTPNWPEYTFSVLIGLPINSNDSMITAGVGILSHSTTVLPSHNSNQNIPLKYISTDEEFIQLSTPWHNSPHTHKTYSLFGVLLIHKIKVYSMFSFAVLLILCTPPSVQDSILDFNIAHTSYLQYSLNLT